MISKAITISPGVIRTPPITASATSMERLTSLERYWSSSRRTSRPATPQQSRTLIHDHRSCIDWGTTIIFLQPHAIRSTCRIHSRSAPGGTITNAYGMAICPMRSFASRFAPTASACTTPTALMPIHRCTSTARRMRSISSFGPTRTVGTPHQATLRKIFRTSDRPLRASRTFRGMAVRKTRREYVPLSLSRNVETTTKDIPPAMAMVSRRNSSTGFSNTPGYKSMSPMSSGITARNGARRKYCGQRDSSARAPRTVTVMATAKRTASVSDVTNVAAVARSASRALARWRATERVSADAAFTSLSLLRLPWQSAAAPRRRSRALSRTLSGSRGPFRQARTDGLTPWKPPPYGSGARVP